MSSKLWPLAAVILGCAGGQQKTEVQPVASAAPTPTPSPTPTSSPSPSIVASAAPVVEPAPVLRCLNGREDGAAAPAVYAVDVRGEAVATPEVTAENVHHAACRHLERAQECIALLASTRRAAINGTFELEIKFALGEGRTVTVSGGTLTDAEARKCIVDAVTDAGGLSKHSDVFGAGKGTAKYRGDVDARWPAGPHMFQKPIVVTGKLSEGFVERQIAKARASVVACYEDGHKSDPGLAGVLVVKTTIDKSGKAATTVDKKATTLKSASVTQCVFEVYRTIAFPSPDSGAKAQVDVTYDFRTGE